MGRPKKIENIEKGLENLDPNLKELVQQLLDVKTKDLKAENSALKKELETPKKKSEYKFVPANTKIKVRSNIDGMFLFSHNKGKVNVYLTIPNYNDIADLDYDEVKVVNSAKSDIFRSGMISIEDVISESDDITLNDVYYDLRLAKLYKNKYNPRNFEELFSDDVPYQVFERYLLDNKEIIETVMIIGGILYRQGKLNDNSKIEFFRRYFNNRNLYR
jgi:hypothetical protein